MTHVVAHEFQKSAGELIRVCLVEFKKKRYVDLRLYFDASDSEAPDWKPSKKGLCLPLHLLYELKEGIGKAVEEYEKGRDNGQTDEKHSGACTNGGGHKPDQDARAMATGGDRGEEGEHEGK